MMRLTFEPRGTPRAIAATLGEGLGRRGVREHPLAMGGGGGRARGLATPQPNLTLSSGPPLRPWLEPCTSQQRRQDVHSPTLPPLVNSCMPPTRLRARTTSYLTARGANESRLAARVGKGAGALTGGGSGWDPECSEGSPLAE